MEDKIARWGTCFLDDASASIRPQIQSYENLFHEIDKLFISQDIVANLKYKYKKIIDTRYSLVGCMTFDEDFVAKSVFYLESIESFLKEYFAYNGNKSEIVSKRILRQIIQFDCSFVDDAKEELEIGFGNPIVLESLLISYYQSKDLNEEINKTKNRILNRLYQELYKNKFDRLFRDIIILFENEFYRIVDVNFIEKNIAKSFKAKRENDLTSIESISVTRLFEKITQNLDKESKEPYKVLLIGDFWEDKDIPNLSVLARMLKSASYEVEISRCDKTGVYDLVEQKDLSIEDEYKWIEERSTKQKDTSSDLLTPKGIENCVKTYDQVFILDCPEIYRDIELVEKKDKSEILEKSNRYTESNLGYEIEWKNFKNKSKNTFASIYYRTQNYLLDINKENSRKSRYINEPLLDYIKTTIDILEKRDNIRKEVYVYVSNNKDFQTEMYDRYNFVRLERYNSKDCKIIKFSKPEGLPGVTSRQSSIIITLYKLLKMLSPAKGFHTFFTAAKKDDFVKAANIARNVDIIINYAPVDLSKKEMDLDIVVNIRGNLKDARSVEDVQEIVKCLVYEMFNFEDSNNLKESRANIIKYCYKKAVANVFSGCVSNFNDCLFYHLYLKKVMGYYKFDKAFDFNFNINSVKYSSDDVDRDKPHYNYSFKRLAYSLMEILDADYFREDKLYEHMFQARLNNQYNFNKGLDYYVEGIVNACNNLNYTSSYLLYRLMKYYK